VNYKLDRVRKVFRDVWIAALGILTTFLVVGIILKSVDALPGRLLLTCIGIATGAFIADLVLGGMRRTPLAAMGAIVPLVASQICYYFLVWVTDFRADHPMWRCWWMSMVASVTSAHIIALRNTTAPKNDWIERFTPVCALFTGFWLMTFALRRELPPTPSDFEYWGLGTFSAGSVLGTLIVWRRRVRAAGPSSPMARWARWTLITISQVAIFFLGFYFGGGGTSGPSPFEMMPSALQGMSREQIEKQLDADLATLKTITAGLDDLAAKSSVLQAELKARQAKEGRQYYRPEEEDQIRWHFVTYLSYRTALLRMAATYSGFESVRHPDTKSRCFMVGYTASVTTYQASLALVQIYADQAAARRKLNEAEPNWGIPPGMFDKIYDSVTNPRHRELCAEMAVYYQVKKEQWTKDADFSWMSDRIQQALAYIEKNGVSQTQAWIDKQIKRVKQDAYKPVYAAQSVLSTWIGDTKIVQYDPLIGLDQIAELEKKLQPGDIILERRNWFLSNAFLPGFWPHGALYVGRYEDLQKLGIADHPTIVERLGEYRKKGHDGHDLTVLESISDGVVFNSLEHSMHADYVAVLRPRLTKEQIGQAIVRAFSHQGKPYDFEFDFFTSDKLVCTELIYRSYEGMLHFDLVRVAGRDTLPAIEIVRKFSREQNTPKQELDFVLFLDGDPALRKAKFAGVEEFCESANRQRAFNE
jgi:hypothetical protein